MLTMDTLLLSTVMVDDGTLVGLCRRELLDSLRTLERMADELGATVIVLKEIRLEPVGEDTGKRGKWERWKAQVSDLKEKEKLQQQQQQQHPHSHLSQSTVPKAGNFVARKATRSALINRRAGPSSNPVAPPAHSSSSTSNGSTSHSRHDHHPFTHLAPTKPNDIRNAYESSLTSCPDTIAAPITTESLALSLPRFADRSLRKKKPADLLDCDKLDRHRLSNHHQPTSRKWRHHRAHPTVASHPHGGDDADEEDDIGIFSVFELELGPIALEPSLADSSTSDSHRLHPPSQQPVFSKRFNAVSAKKAKEDERAAKRRRKKQLQLEREREVQAVANGDERALGLAPRAGKEEDQEEEEEEEEGWIGQSLDAWDDSPGTIVDPATPVPPTACHLPSSLPGIEAIQAELDDSSIRRDPSHCSDSSPSCLSTTSPTKTPSPILSPLYRPPTSLLSTTPRAAFPPEQLPLIPLIDDDDLKEDDDGTERICVEALVVRKEMAGHIDFDDLGRWMNGEGLLAT